MNKRRLNPDITSIAFKTYAPGKKEWKGFTSLIRPTSKRDKRDFGTRLIERAFLGKK